MKTPVGLRKVCPYCASTDVSVRLSGGGDCNSCKRPVKEFKEMRWMEVQGFRKDLALRERYKQFSLKHCDETHAFFFILLLAVIIVLFILLG